MGKLAENLKIARLMRGKSLRQVAQLIQISPSTLSNWEKGNVSPNADVIIDLCSVYKIPPNQLLGWEPCPEIEEFKKEYESDYQHLEMLEKEKAVLEARIKAYSDKLSRFKQ